MTRGIVAAAVGVAIATMAAMAAMAAMAEDGNIRTRIVGSEGSDTFFAAGCPGGKAASVIVRAADTDAEAPRVCYRLASGEESCSTTADVADTAELACAALPATDAARQ